MATPHVDWNRPAGVPANGRLLWEDPTWRDLDAGTIVLLRNQVILAMQGGGPAPEAGPGFGMAALAAGALGVGLAAAGRGTGRRRKRR